MVSSSGLSCRSSPRISAPICWVNGTTSSRALVIATIGGVEAEKTAGERPNDGEVTSRRDARPPGGSRRFEARPPSSGSEEHNSEIQAHHALVYRLLIVQK